VKRVVRVLGAALVGMLAIAGTATYATADQSPGHHAASAADHHGHEVAARIQLALLRLVTARFHDLDAAQEAGYELGWVNGAGNRIITGCVAHPTAGAMGYHYFNPELMDDLDVNVLQPEVLVYAPGPRGRLRLVAVEWVARGPNTNPPGVSEPPTVLGMPMHILVPAVGFYIKHAWVWRSNPAGMFADWNPRVTCP
jgi:hypothetical protein